MSTTDTMSTDQLFPNGYDRHAMSTTASTDTRTWTFLTNHAHVLIAISRNPELRQRDIAQLVGITEGAVTRIIHELEECGYLVAERVGRRNRYQLDPGVPMRHPLESNRAVGQLIESMND